MTAPDLDRLSPAAALRAMKERVASYKSQMAGETRAREQAESSERAAIVRADRAEHSERQLTAERDRWKRLAIQYEAELRALSPPARRKGLEPWPLATAQ
jgi:hypothetical protein